MAKPTVPVEDLEIATNANYAGGPDIGTATKSEPSAGRMADGWRKGNKPPAQEFNWWWHWIADWVRFFYNEMLSPLITDAGVLKPDVVTKEAINVDVAGNGLTQDGTGALQVEVDDVGIQIVSDELRIKADGITTTKILDDNVTGAKLAPAVADNGLVQDGSGNLQVNVDDVGIQIVSDELRIKADGVTTTKILDDNVTGAKLAAAVAGNGLVQDGSGNLDVNVDDVGIQIVADELRIKAAGVVESKLGITGAGNYHYESVKTYQYTIGPGDFFPWVDDPFTQIGITGNGSGIRDLVGTGARLFSTIRLPNGCEIISAEMGYASWVAGMTVRVRVFPVTKSTGAEGAAFISISADTTGYQQKTQSGISEAVDNAAKYYHVDLLLDGNGASGARFNYLEVTYEMTNLLPVG